MNRDLISDALTRIRNSVIASNLKVDVVSNGVVRRIVEILKEEGFIEDFSVIQDTNPIKLNITLRYYQKKPVIRGLKRVSTYGRRQYTSSRGIKPTYNNLGIGIISTSKGIISDKEAKFLNVGGEYLCKVW